MFSPIVILALFECWIHHVGAVACYGPNGEDRNKEMGFENLEAYAPCNANSPHSMCCGWGSNRTNAGTADTCLPNGLCQAPVDTWRESCTDPTWQAPECVKLFVNGTGYGGEPQVNDDNGNPLVDVKITVCDNGSFCYGRDNRACCQQGQGVWVDAQGLQTNVNPSTSSSGSSSTLSTPSTTATPDLPGTTTPTPEPSSGLSTGAQAGIGAGVGAAAVVAAIVAGCWFVRKRKYRAGNSQLLAADAKYFSEPPPQHQNSPLPPTGLQPNGSGQSYHGQVPMQEMESSSASSTNTPTKNSTPLVEVP